MISQLQSNTPQSEPANAFDQQMIEGYGAQSQNNDTEHITTPERIRIDGMLDVLNGTDWLDDMFDFAPAPEVPGRDPTQGPNSDAAHAAPANSHPQVVDDYPDNISQSARPPGRSLDLQYTSSSNQVPTIPGYLSSSLREELTELYEQLTRLREECAHRDRQIQRMRAYIVQNEAWSQSISDTLSHHQAWIQLQEVQTSGTLG